MSESTAGTNTERERETGKELVSLVRVDQDVVRLRLLRRSRRNALDFGLLAAFTAAIEEVEKDPAARFVIIDGEGCEAFCAGADRGTLGTVDEAGAIEFISALHQALASLRHLDQVTIAVIRGHCIGAGLELAAACDFRIADVSARFSMPEVLVGIPSVVEAALLPRLIGWGAATDWMLTGRTVSASEAQSSGLLQRLVEVGQLDRATSELIEQLRPACPRAQAMQKQLFRVWEEAPLSKAIEAGVSALGRAYRSSNGVIEPHRRLGPRK